MGFFDRARVFLGIDKAEEKSPSHEERSAPRPVRKAERPPLPEARPSPGATLEDVIAARAAGDCANARTLLAAMDRGHGLRAVLRAAAALEARDEAELAVLLPALAGREPSWQLTLQLAAALEGGDERRPTLVKDAERLGAPRWAIAWLAALSSHPDVQRQGLVDLLFEDAGLARTIAARDLHVDKVLADNGAIARYAAFAHGRDIVRQFGAAPVADLLDRLRGRPA